VIILPNATKSFFTNFESSNCFCILFHLCCYQHMIVNNNIFIMHLVEKFFKTFTKKEICDTAKDTEVIIALSTESREKADEMILNVIEAGGKETREPQDHGWMY
jgi:predicted lactoylglutathione lyase